MDRIYYILYSNKYIEPTGHAKIPSRSIRFRPHLLCPGRKRNQPTGQLGAEGAIDLVWPQLRFHRVLHLGWYIYTVYILFSLQTDRICRRKDTTHKRRKRSLGYHNKIDLATKPFVPCSSSCQSSNADVCWIDIAINMLQQHANTIVKSFPIPTTIQSFIGDWAPSILLRKMGSKPRTCWQSLD